MGTEGSLQFPVVKLLDYVDRFEELEKSSNPFALVVIAHLKTRATARAPQTRLEWKTRLLEWLYREGRTSKEVVDLFRFLELVMVLPEKQQQRFERAVEEQEVKKSAYVLTPFEIHAMERGERLGALRAAREDVLENLAVHFGSVPAGVAERVQAIDDRATLKKLLGLAITSASIEEFERALSQPPR